MSGKPLIHSLTPIPTFSLIIYFYLEKNCLIFIHHNYFSFNKFYKSVTNTLSSLMPIEMENLHEKIAEVRSHILDLYNENKELYDENDIKRILHEDYLIERDLLIRKSIKDTKEMLPAALRFRKELNVSKLKAVDFPLEFHKLAIVFHSGYDKEGNGLIYLRLKHYRRVKELEHLIKQFLLYHIDELDKKTQQKGMAIVMDFRSTGLVNVDMELMWFLLRALIQYFPYAFNQCYLYQLSFVYRSIWSAIQRLLPVELLQKMKMVNDKTIFDYIDPQNLPLFMGGKCAKNFYQLPQNCITASEMGFSEKEYQNYLKVYKYQLEECERESKQLAKNELNSY